MVVVSPWAPRDCDGSSVCLVLVTPTAPRRAARSLRGMSLTWDLLLMTSRGCGLGEAHGGELPSSSRRIGVHALDLRSCPRGAGLTPGEREHCGLLSCGFCFECWCLQRQIYSWAVEGFRSEPSTEESTPD